MKFGVPNQRAPKKAELFPNTPVLTVGIDGGKGTSRAMTLNNKAVETLGLPAVNAVVAFGFDENKVFITNGNQEDIPDEHQIRVTKGNPRKISEKRTYEYISNKVFSLDNSIENHFELSLVEDEEVNKVYELTLMISEDNTSVQEPVLSFAEQETLGSEAFNESMEIDEKDNLQ